MPKEHRLKISRAKIYIKISKKQLYNLYWNINLSALKIAKLLSCSKCSIYRKMLELNIPTRAKKEARSLVDIDGKNNPTYIDGRSLGKYYCIDCSKKEIKTKINWRTWFYGTKRCFSCAHKVRGKRMIGIYKGKNSSAYGKIQHGKRGKYKGINMRSSYEIAYAKYLDKNNINWLYESKTFEIIYNYKGKKREGTYTPDFYLPRTKQYIEIKGWWRDNAKEKFEAFRKKYPEIKINILMQKELKDLKILK